MLTLNTEASSFGSANALDSLAEAYATLGEKDRAIALYRKALQIDPDFQNAADRLKELTETAP